MKGFSKIFITAAIVLLNTTAAFAAPDPEYWEIKNFHSDIYLTNDLTYKVTETIIADFTNEAHRGIGRVIPEGKTPIQFISSVNENGKEWINTIRRYNNHIDIESLNHELEYRNDINTYIITYIVKYGFKYFDTHDELHWNVNGTEWPVDVNQISATVYLPEGLSTENIKLSCNTGEYRSREQACTHTLKNNTVEFKSNRPLNRYENLSIVVGMPVGTIKKPTAAEKREMLKKRYWPLTIPVTTFIIMFTLWYYKGRDEKTLKNTVIPHYKPPQNLLPTEVGTIIDEAIDTKDITATIIHFAINGNIKITEVESKIMMFKQKDHELEIIKPYKTEKEFEKKILEGIFPLNEAGVKIKISKLENKFYTRISSIKKSIITELIKDGYFTHNPATIKGIFIGIASVMAIITFQTTMLLGLPLAGALFLSAIIIAAFGYHMPRKTKKGAETYYQLKGLYEYINTAEKDRLKFQEDANIIFEKLLPYAMAFGIVKKWTKAFEGIIKTPPNWYHSPYDHFSMINFSRSLSGLGKQINSTVTSRPSSNSSGFGGGGFSGGGFGGGGGGGR